MHCSEIDEFSPGQSRMFILHTTTPPLIIPNFLVLHQTNHFPPWFSPSLVSQSARLLNDIELSEMHCELLRLAGCVVYYNKVLTPTSIPTGIPNFSPLQRIPPSLKFPIFAFQLHFEQSR